MIPSRRVLLAVLVLCGLAAVVILWLRWWTSPKAVNSGGVTIIVAGHAIPPTESTVNNQGVSGTLGLIENRCIGLAGDNAGVVIVWPPGTRLVADQEAVRIEYRDLTFSLGDEIFGGTFDMNPETARGDLPDACATSRLIAFEPEAS